jgi:hypothetical protein
MEVASEFRKHAANCNKMAKVSKDTETKAVWLGLRSSTMPTDLNDHQRIRNANDPERRTSSVAQSRTPGSPLVAPDWSRSAAYAFMSTNN